MCFARCESIQVEAMKNRKCFYVYPLVVEPTRLKNRSQIGSFPNPGARGENKYVCHHHLDVQHISKLDRKPKQVEQFLEHVLFETMKNTGVYCLHMTYLPFCWCFPSSSSSSSSSSSCCCCCCQTHQEATIKQKPRRESTKKNRL